MAILRVLVVVCIAGWLGISTFFSFAVAPLAFRVIDRGAAGQLVSAALPRYYEWGVVLTVIALIASAAPAASGYGPRVRALVSTALCAAMLGLLLWASLVVLPRAESARGGAAATGGGEGPPAPDHQEGERVGGGGARGGGGTPSRCSAPGGGR